MKLTVRQLVLAALFAAIMAVCAQLSIPMPIGVPITLQTLAVACCGYILGAKLGVFSIAAYIALGAVGLPVFSAFRGGIGMLLGVTGGFIWGFIPMVFLCGYTAQKKPVLAVAGGLCGMLICHLAGVAQFSVVSGTPFVASLVAVSAPYLIKDVCSVVFGYIFARTIKKVLPRVQNV